MWLHLTITFCLQTMSRGPGTDQREAVSREYAHIREEGRTDSTGETVRIRVCFLAMVTIWCHTVVTLMWVAVHGQVYCSCMCSNAINYPYSL